jgi:Holliday junction resolvase RusA-like endonuclease
MLPFEFVIMGPPVSQQTRYKPRRRAWIEELRTAIAAIWPRGEKPAVGPVRVGITHVFATVSIDLDNLAKPVRDALKGIVLEDDEQVRELTMRKQELDQIARIQTFRPLLLEALERGEEFLHVLVEEATDQEVVV